MNRRLFMAVVHRSVRSEMYIASTLISHLPLRRSEMLFEELE